MILANSKLILDQQYFIINLINLTHELKQQNLKEKSKSFYIDFQDLIETFVDCSFELQNLSLEISKSNDETLIDPFINLKNTFLEFQSLLFSFFKEIDFNPSLKEESINYAHSFNQLLFSMSLKEDDFSFLFFKDLIQNNIDLFKQENEEENNDFMKHLFEINLSTISLNPIFYLNFPFTVSQLEKIFIQENDFNGCFYEIINFNQNIHNKTINPYVILTFQYKNNLNYFNLKNYINSYYSNKDHLLNFLNEYCECFH